MNLTAREASGQEASLIAVLTSDPGEETSPKERASWLKTKVRLNGLRLSNRELILWLFENEIALVSSLPS
jgi:hypothetical protein